MSEDFGNLTAAMEKAGKTKRVKEFEWSFLPGFFVNLVYVSKHHVTQMRETARTVDKNPRSNRDEVDFSEKKIWGFYADRIIKGWRGFTVRYLTTLMPALVIETVENLKKLFPGQISDKEIPKDQDVGEYEVGYSRQLTMLLFKYSLEFENFVVNTASDLRNYVEIAKEKEAQLENLK